MADNKTIERIRQEVVSANKDTLYQATLKDTEQEQYIQHKFPKDFKGGETYNDIFKAKIKLGREVQELEMKHDNWLLDEQMKMINRELIIMINERKGE